MAEQFKRKIIEDWFPIESVGEEGRLEKTSPSGRIQSLHQWHARRPTSAIRAVLLASLLEFPESTEEKEIIKELIIQYSRRFIPKTYTYPASISSKDDAKLEKVLVNILNEQVPKSIRALDPFAGGGSIPNELGFLGVETYGSDLNPVSILINKATTEFFFLTSHFPRSSNS